ncbi:MAG: universal stress protein [Bacteroidota bacterium]|nr:universal stress protein [Bacteroidota bacterium]
MKKIIIATDFSPAALNATNYAADMALLINAEIVLLHVFLLRFNYSEIPIAMNSQKMWQDAENEINEIRGNLYKKTNNKIIINTQIQEGVFFHELKNLCELIKPYTVVIGSQGKTLSDRIFWGSHALQAVKNLDWPIITVPPGAKFSSVKKIGLACDLYALPDKVQIEEIKKLVTDFNAELHVVNVNIEKGFNPGNNFESMKLKQLLNSIKATYHFISAKNTDEGITEFVEQNNIDLLIMLPKRHSLFERVMYTSNTKQLVLHSHSPVMALHS